MFQPVQYLVLLRLRHAAKRLRLMTLQKQVRGKAMMVKLSMMHTKLLVVSCTVYVLTVLMPAV